MHAIEEFMVMEENISNLLFCNRHTHPSYQTLAWPDLFLLMITLMYQHR